MRGRSGGRGSKGIARTSEAASAVTASAAATARSGKCWGAKVLGMIFEPSDNSLQGAMLPVGTEWRHVARARTVSSLSLLLLLLLASRTTAAVAQATCPAQCPSSSTCSSYLGAPVCLCPLGQQFVKGICSSAPLANVDWLAWMNNARAAVGSPFLTWDSNLASVAQNYAEHLGRTGCKPVHSTPKGVGQNLAGGPGRLSKNVNNTMPVLNWLKEGRLYTYHVFDTNTAGCAGSWRKCGHYTQLIWSTSTSVGCGTAPCLSGANTSKMWVCDYKPGGNIVGRYPYKVNPCKLALCPTNATCDSSTGSAVCKCSTGQVILNNTCIADPCLGYNGCLGDLVCDGSSGNPQCSCPEGSLLQSPSSTVCIPPACSGMSCPSPSTCDAAMNVPYCTCSTGSIFQDGSCTITPRSPVMLTSLALYSTTENSSIIRFKGVGHCVKLGGIKISSFSLLWSANATKGSTLPGNITTTSCSKILFWTRRGCNGRASGWKRSQGKLVKKR